MQKKILMFIALVVCAIFAAQPVPAQGLDPQGATLNNISARTRAAGEFRIDGGGRYMEKSEDIAWAGSVQIGLGQGWQTGVTINYFDTESPVGDATAGSEWFGAEISIKKNFVDTDTWALAVQQAVEIRETDSIITGPTGLVTIRTTDDRALFSVAIPVSVNIEADENVVSLEATPKAAFFRDEVSTETGRVIDHYGTVVGITVGGRFPILKGLSIAGDITPIIAGDNSTDDETGELDRKFLWSASATYRFNSNVGIEAYATNAAGTSVGTSLIASSSSDTIFGGLRAIVQF